MGDFNCLQTFYFHKWELPLNVAKKMVMTMKYVFLNLNILRDSWRQCVVKSWWFPATGSWGRVVLKVDIFWQTF